MTKLDKQMLNQFSILSPRLSTLNPFLNGSIPAGNHFDITN